MENYSNSLEPGDEELIEMFGSIKMGELVTSFMGNKYY